MKKNFLVVTFLFAFVIMGFVICQPIAKASAAESLHNESMESFSMEEIVNSYEKDGVVIFDESVLSPDRCSNNYKQTRLLENDGTGLRNEWNIAQKNLQTGALSFFQHNTDAAVNSVEYYQQTEPLSGLNYPVNYGVNNNSFERISVTNNYPQCPTGFLYIEYQNVYNNSTGNDDTLGFVGSAFMMGDDLIVTAGHCLYGDVTNSGNYQDNLFNPRFPTSIQYYPARNGNTYYYGGSVQVKKVYLEKSFYLNLEKDWGCCTLMSNLGELTGSYGLISNWYEYGHDIFSFGYPGNQGGNMYKSQGQVTMFENNNIYYRTNLTVFGGQSGSPIFVTLNSNTYVCGIVTYTSSDGTTDYSGGPRIDGFMFSFITSLCQRNLVDCINDNVYEIRTKAQFNELRTISTVGNTFKLVNDIDLGVTSDNPWNPISGFDGVLNGNGHKISNMIINTTADTGWFGLFASNAGRIENLTVKGDIHVTGSGGQVIAGVFAGINWGTGVITNCQSNVSEAEGNFVAGTQINENGGATAWNFEIYTSRDSAQVGGFVGENQGTINNCTNYSELFGIGDLGGIVGRNFGGTVNSCRNKAIINYWYTINRTVGGIVGYVSGGTICYCVNEAPIACVNPTFSNDTTICPQMAQIIGRKVSGSSYGNSWTGSVNQGALHSFYYGGFLGIGQSYYNQAMYVSNGEIGWVG